MFAVLLNRFSHRQAKELFNYYWQKPTQTRLKKGEKKGKNKGISVLFFVLFSPFLFFMLWHKSTACFVEALFVHGGESHHLFFCSAHLFVCWESDALVLSLCANDTRRNESTVQGRLINDGTLCFGCRTGRAHFLCALGACEHSLWHLQGLHWIVVCEPQPSKTKKTKQVASRWLGDASCLINASCVLRGSAGALEKEHASASLLTAKLAHASTHFLQQQQQLMTCLVRACQTLVRY